MNNAEATEFYFIAEALVSVPDERLDILSHSLESNPTPTLTRILLLMKKHIEDGRSLHHLVYVLDKNRMYRAAHCLNDSLTKAKK